jgi:hypothetical protein
MIAMAFYFLGPGIQEFRVDSFLCNDFVFKRTIEKDGEQGR